MIPPYSVVKGNHFSCRLSSTFLMNQGSQAAMQVRASPVVSLDLFERRLQFA
jgi:hypothetical protein